MKLNGYRASHRNKWFLITQEILSPREFLLFEYYLDLMDFDKSHEDSFATFEAFLDETASVFKKHTDTVRIWHNGLLTKGFIKVVNERRQLYTVKSPTKYIIGLAKWGGEATRYTHEEKNQSQEFILEKIRFFQPKIENIQQESDEVASKSPVSTKNSLTSYKHSSIVPSSIGSKKVVVIKQEVRSEEEYQKIYRDSGFTSLIPDDTKWIDQNISEEIEIESDEQEKEIVRIYFDGNWHNYRKNLKKSDVF